jgi:hypothetical protein
MPTYSLRTAPGVDLSTLGWSRPTPTKAAPTRPAPALPAPRPGEALHTEIDDDHDLDRVVRVLAEAACLNASRELGLPKAPPVKFFTGLTPALADYRRRYFPGRSFKSWSGDRNLLGITDVPRAGGTIWVRADLRGDDLVETVRHEVWHAYEFAVGEEYPEHVAELFARGELELEDAA